MKLTLNGALTIGILDGANVEIHRLVGEENFFLFGLTEPKVQATVPAGYRPHEFYGSNPMLRRALESIAGGEFSRDYLDRIWHATAVPRRLARFDPGPAE
jgi:starch phosphorylase